MADRRFSQSVSSPTPALRSVTRPRRRYGRPHIPVPEGFRNPLSPSVPDAGPTLLPLIGLDDEVDDALDQVLRPVVLRANNGDRAARDALYAAFEPKLMRFVRRIRVPYVSLDAKGLWERDDVIQESYLVFVGLIGSWSPGFPFGPYVLANFPWRLRDAVHRGVARRGIPPRQTRVPIEGYEDPIDTRVAVEEEHAMIGALADSLEPPLGDVLRLHIIEKLTLREIARQIGVSPRSVSRYWQTVLIRLRADDLRIR